MFRLIMSLAENVVVLDVVNSHVFPTGLPDTPDVSASSCDVGFFYSVLCAMSLPNCQHVVGVTTYHSIILAKCMVRNHPQPTPNNPFFSNNKGIKVHSGAVLYRIDRGLRTTGV